MADEGSGAALLATDDEDATIEAITKCSGDDAPDFEDRSYNGVDYQFVDDGAFGVVEGYFVVGTEDAFKDVVDTAESGESLEGTDKYKDALDDLTQDHLLVVYADVKTMVEDAQAQGLDDADLANLKTFFEVTSDRPLSAALSARDNAIVFEYAQGLPADEELADLTEATAGSDIVARLPGGSWGALGIGNFGDFVDGLLSTYSDMGTAFFSRDVVEQQFRAETGLSLSDDVLAWMGDLGIFVQGTSITTVSGGVVIETSDVEASRNTVEKLHDYLAKDGAPIQELTMPGVEGFSIQGPPIPQPVNVAVGDDRVVVAYGNLATEQALETEVTLEENENFQAAQDALGEDFSVAGYFEADPIQTFIEAAALAELASTDPEQADRYNEDIKPFIDPLSFFVFGQKVEGETSVTKLVVGAE